MKTLHYTRPHHAGKLYAELLAAIPALAPVLVDGVPTAVLLLSHRDDDLWLTVPDDTAEPAVAAVVAAHDPTPPPAPDAALRSAIVQAVQSCVGVRLADLTQAQRLALIAALLFRAGAVDRTTLAIRPLAEWL